MPRRRPHAALCGPLALLAGLSVACAGLVGPPPPPPTPGGSVPAIEVLGPGSGFVSDAALGFVCSGRCDAPPSPSLTLKAEPAAGSLFAGWGGDCAGTQTATCSLPSSAGLHVSATFEPTTSAQVQPSPVRPGCADASCPPDRVTSTIRLAQGSASYRGAELVIESPTLVPVAVTPSQALSAAGCLTAVGPDKVVVACLASAIGDGDVVDVAFERVADGDAVLALHDAYLVDGATKVPVLGAGVLVEGAP